MATRVVSTVGEGGGKVRVSLGLGLELGEKGGEH